MSLLHKEFGGTIDDLAGLDQRASAQFGSAKEPIHIRSVCGPQP